VVEAPVERAWDAIYESEQWPEWWKDVKEVKELVKGDEHGVGSVRRYTLSSPTGYKLSFDLLLTEFKQHQLLKGDASGDLEGTGAWHFKEEGQNAVVECHWSVSPTLWWMKILTPFLAPFFRYNHRLVMNSGAKALAVRLNAKLLSY
jgi:hypothetical protein